MPSAFGGGEEGVEVGVKDLSWKKGSLLSIDRGGETAKPAGNSSNRCGSDLVDEGVPAKSDPACAEEQGKTMPVPFKGIDCEFSKTVLAP